MFAYIIILIPFFNYGFPYLKIYLNYGKIAAKATIHNFKQLEFPDILTHYNVFSTAEEFLSTYTLFPVTNIHCDIRHFLNI